MVLKYDLCENFICFNRLTLTSNILIEWAKSVVFNVGRPTGGARLNFGGAWRFKILETNFGGKIQRATSRSLC